MSLAFAAGAAWALVGAPLGMAPLAALLLLVLPKRASERPGAGPALVLAGVAGLVSTLALGGAASCAPDGAGMQDVRRGSSPQQRGAREPVVLVGLFLAATRAGSGPFVTDVSCGPFTVVTGDALAPAGVQVRLRGSWRQGRHRPWFQAHEVTELPDAAPSAGGAFVRWRAVRWRDVLVGRIDRLYGEHAPLVAALTLARREGLDPELRESFSRVGIAHLLAISGFHVGVIAGVLLALASVSGLDRRRASVAAVVGSWAYVAFIGFPDAACRAALILSAASVSRARGRPTARWGALGTALLLLSVTDPRRLAGAGFQLSFAGAAGLVAWSGGLSRWLRKALGRRCPRSVATGLAAGVAATLATLPIVAWHFERISLVGIPVTLLATPLVSLGLVGALGSLCLDFVSPGLASVLAGGVGVPVAGLEWIASHVGAVSWASVWTTRGTVIGMAAGVTTAGVLARRPGVGARARRMLTAVYVAAAVLAWPLLLGLQGLGSVEILVIDVGQGDAIAIRSPRGRWVLVDTGPAARDGDPGGHPVVRALRARGVSRLEALVLTHPDLDHIGGATSVLARLEVGVVYDPGLPAGKEAFVDVLEDALASHVPWRAARAGDLIEVDGLELRVLHPDEAVASSEESNASSVVLHAVFGDFDALLTGDAYKDVDRKVASALTDVVEVLKVGHHGSDTSTDPELLETARPGLAVISVGRNNRYGHPDPAVIGRLERSGALIRRTDRAGSVSVRGRRDGGYSVGLGR